MAAGKYDESLQCAFWDNIRLKQYIALKYYYILLEDPARLFPGLIPTLNESGLLLRQFLSKKWHLVCGSKPFRSNSNTDLNTI